MTDRPSPAPPTVAVLIPTFDHGAIIRHAIRSVLAQTVAVHEVLVVGDGAPEITETTVAALAAEDSRVRWFPHAKGERHGEVHRHRVLTDACESDIVFYLGDDDLYLPDHVEQMLGALEDRDCVFGIDMPIRIDTGTPKGRVHDFGRARHRRELLNGPGRCGMTSFAHRLDSYRRLDIEWTTTPPGVNTDTYFFRKWVRAGADMASLGAPTAIHFGSGGRRDVSAEDREAEVAAMARHLGDEGWRRRSLADPLFTWARDVIIRHEAREDGAQQSLAEAEERISQLETELRGAHRDLQSGRVAVRTLRRKLAARMRPGSRPRVGG